MAQPKLNEDLNYIQRANLEITKLGADLDIIAKLDDEPNDVGGLTSAQLKETFDKAGNTIKTYINETLIPELLASDAVEQGRVEAEAARVVAEQARVTAEQERVNAEVARNTWGEYSESVQYVPGNKVAYKGSSYVCRRSVTGVSPEDSSAWLMIAKQGEIGPMGLPGRGLTILGYYETQEALEAAQTNPAPGDAYGVGSAEPYDIYVWSGTDSRWVNNGKIQGADGKPGPPGPQGPGSVFYETTIPTAGWSKSETTGVTSLSLPVPGVTAAANLHVDHRYTGDGSKAAYERYVQEENQFLNQICNGYAETYDGGIKFHIFGNAPSIAIPIVAEVR